MLQPFFLSLVYIYISLTLTYKLAQLILGSYYHLKHQKIDVTNFDPSYNTGVIIPVYNETKQILSEVFQYASLTMKQLPSIRLVIVDDGSNNPQEIKELYQHYFANLQDRAELVVQLNGGKREAQIEGLSYLDVSCKYVITVDSDTIIQPKQVQTLIQSIENTQAGAVTGDAVVANKNVNLLTRLISLRYYLAFNLERASQSVFGSVLCCTGVFTIYNRDLLETVKEDYLNQSFLDHRCTYGDDRHLTNLVLKQDEKVLFEKEAWCHTFVPETVPDYIRQQIRWNKSFFREFTVSVRNLSKMSLYSAFTLLAQPLLLILFPLSLANALALITSNGYYAWQYLVIIIVMGLLNSLYGFIFTSSRQFILFPIYSLLHLFVLFPIKLESLATLRNCSWSTRGSVQTIWLQTIFWMSFVFFSVCLLSIFL
jgi:hyaluronan synthase/N-acetylglucosaminyltransferase